MNHWKEPTLMDLARAQLHSRHLPAAAANAPSHAEHSHQQSSV